MSFLRACAYGLFLMIALALAPAARGGDLQVDLLGWRLQQFDNGVADAMGEPWKTLDQGNRSSRLFRLGKQGYFAIHTDRRVEHYIDSLQVTGFGPGPELIHGLRLGDPREKVLAALGQPDRIRPLDISPVHPLKVDVWEYDDRNYSIELDPRGRLYSLLLFSNEHLFAFPPDSSPEPWDELAAAATSGNFERLEPLLRPDIEVYRGDDTLSNHRRYQDFVASPPADLLAAFFDLSSGVAAVARQPAPAGFARVVEKMGVGMVYQFPADSLLEEVVFFPYLGSWRVYEVRFRDADDTGAPAGSQAPVERG